MSDENTTSTWAILRSARFQNGEDLSSAGLATSSGWKLGKSEPTGCGLRREPSTSSRPRQNCVESSSANVGLSPPGNSSTGTKLRSHRRTGPAFGAHPSVHPSRGPPSKRYRARQGRRTPRSRRLVLVLAIRQVLALPGRHPRVQRLIWAAAVTERESSQRERGATNTRWKQDRERSWREASLD